MRPYRHVLLPWLALIALGGCVKQAPPAPPETVTQAMENALLDTGFYREVSITRTVGRHYAPADDAWTIVACFTFTVPDGRQGNSCLDSFSATQLDNGSWLVGVTANGAYRWRALPAQAGESAAPPSGSPGQPGGQQAQPEPEQRPGEDSAEEPGDEPAEEPAEPDDPAAMPA